MRLLTPLLLLLPLLDLLQASPIPQTSQPLDPPPKTKWLTWRTWVPLAGTAAFLSSLATFVYLGTHSEERYKASKLQSIDEKLHSLPEEDQQYLEERHIFVGKKDKELTPKVIERLKYGDQQHGFPGMQVPDLRGVDKETRKEVKVAYDKLQQLMKEVHKTEGEKRETERMVEYVQKVKINAQREAAVIVATNVKDAWRKAGLLDPPP